MAYCGGGKQGENSLLKRLSSIDGFLTDLWNFISRSYKTWLEPVAGQTSHEAIRTCHSAGGRALRFEVTYLHPSNLRGKNSSDNLGVRSSIRAIDSQRVYFVFARGACNKRICFSSTAHAYWSRWNHTLSRTNHCYQSLCGPKDDWEK